MELVSFASLASLPNGRTPVCAGCDIPGSDVEPSPVSDIGQADDREGSPATLQPSPYPLRWCRRLRPPIGLPASAGTRTGGALNPAVSKYHPDHGNGVGGDVVGGFRLSARQTTST